MVPPGAVAATDPRKAEVSAPGAALAPRKPEVSAPGLASLGLGLPLGDARSNSGLKLAPSLARNIGSMLAWPHALWPRACAAACVCELLGWMGMGLEGCCGC